jgi:hypothetical protein
MRLRHADNVSGKKDYAPRLKPPQHFVQLRRHLSLVESNNQQLPDFLSQI